MYFLRRSGVTALCFWLIVGNVARAQTADVPAGHSMHGEAFNTGPRQAAYLMGGTGKVDFPVTTKTPMAQLFFDQGLGQLHGFWYWEAERSFRQAATLDADCAMAYWGIAMANTNNAERALKFIREAKQRSANITPRESRYIEALSNYYEDWDKSRNDEPAKKTETAATQPAASNERAKSTAGEETPSTENKPAAEKNAAKSDGRNQSRKGRRRATDDPKKAAEKKRKQVYLDKLTAITKDFPDDLEAKAFLANYRWNWRNDVPIGNRDDVEALLQQVFGAEPMHPAHHYRIHLWDDSKPQRALTSAALCGPSAPAIAHMWHMPGHIYSKLHRYDDAAYQQEASARVDHAYMMRDRIMPYQIHNYAHNNEWLARNLVYVGRVRDALDVARNLIEVPRHPKLNSPTERGSAAHFGRERLFDTLVLFEQWHEIIHLAGTPYLDGGESAADEIRRIRWLGAAHLSIGNRIQGAEQLAELVARQESLQKQQDEAGQQAETKAREEKKSDDDVAKARENARRGFDERLKTIEKALAHLDGLEAAATGDHAGAVKLFEQAGDLPKPHLALAWLRAGDFEKAEKLAREAVDAGKNQVFPLAVYVEVLHGLEKHDEAKRHFEQLRTLAASSDLRAPIFDRLADMARQWGYPYGWRVSAPPANDLGPRPALESLGPFRWQTQPATPWILFGADGKPVSLYDYAGRPVVVIFYLGYGCLHCAEQMKTFAPLAADFNAAGISLVAISTDSVEDLKKALESFQVAPSGGSGSESPEARVPSPTFAAADGAAGALDQAAASAAVANFPITLASNNDLRAFRAYRCFDDFEGRPLHGTFLIDREGLIRWQEIGAEPFNDAEFLLKEAKRLLELPR